MTDQNNLDSQPTVWVCSELAEKLQEQSGVNVMECYQCGKCSAGCTVAEVTDILPHDAVRMMQLNQKEELLDSHYLWLCVGCQTCVTRCPNRIDIPHIMDTMRHWALEEKRQPKESTIAQFHDAFVNSIRKNGRVHELGMVGEYKRKSGSYMQNMRMGMAMFFRGKIGLLPHKVKRFEEIREIFEKQDK